MAALISGTVTLMKQRGAHIIWSVLVEQGVDTVFGYPGGAILPAYDALLDHPIRHVLVRHEQGATHMADGYARASGKVGVAIATSGPGATNLVTGIATAMMDSIPLVCITGQVPAALIGSDAFQETDITGITLTITKHNFLVTKAADIAPTLREAFAIATSGRPGPVLVDITKNAQQEECEFEPRDPCGERRHRADWRHASAPLAPTRARTAPRATSCSPKSKRPVILAGHGILKSGAMSEVLELAERAHIPVAMTLLGIGSAAGASSAQPRHDGHARRGVGQRSHPGSRPADRARHALRRSRHRQAVRTTRRTPRRSTSTSTRPSCTRTCAPTWRSPAT